jgi:hypothetical protein
MREMIHGRILIYYVKTSKEKYFDDLEIEAQDEFHLENNY